MKCFHNLDYNIRMSVFSLNKCIILLTLVFTMTLLGGCGNKGPLNLPDNFISTDK